MQRLEKNGTLECLRRLVRDVSFRNMEIKHYTGDNDHVQPLKLGDIRMNFRRLSKMVLGGYGGASLLFFGIPYPDQQPPTASAKDTKSSKGKAPETSENIPEINLVKEEEEVLAQLVHDADDEEIQAGSSALPHTRDLTGDSRYSPQHTRTPTASSSTATASTARTGPYPNSIGRAGSVPFPSVSTTNLGPTSTGPTSAQSPTESHSTTSGDGPAITAAPIPSWWEIVTGKRDQEIFEGFASAAIAAGEIKEGAKEARKELKRGLSRKYILRMKLTRPTRQ